MEQEREQEMELEMEQCSVASRGQGLGVSLPGHPQGHHSGRSPEWFPMPRPGLSPWCCAPGVGHRHGAGAEQSPRCQGPRSPAVPGASGTLPAACVGSSLGCASEQRTPGEHTRVHLTHLLTLLSSPPLPSPAGGTEVLAQCPPRPCGGSAAPAPGAARPA